MKVGIVIALKPSRMKDGGKHAPAKRCSMLYSQTQHLAMLSMEALAPSTKIASDWINDLIKIGLMLH